MKNEINELCFVDVETTGARATYDRIIEIGIILVRDGQVIEEYSSLIDPQCSIPVFIQNFTGIRESDLQDAPTFAQVIDKVEEMLKGRMFVAHNVRFDHAFIRNEFRRLGRDLKVKQLCTVKLSRRLYPQYKKHNLDALIERFGLCQVNRHRALDDAKAMYEFWQVVHRDHSEALLLETFAKLLKQPSIPIHIDTALLEDLPHSPGIYIFYGNETEIPLYIGKSTDIRSRVLSHFSADHFSSKELRMAQQLRSIETVRTAGELGALLLEARLIKEKMPIYNRMLRKYSSLCALETVQDQAGFLRVEIHRDATVCEGDIQRLSGVFRTRREAEKALQTIADEQGLCHRYLGLEKTKGVCFAYHLKKCRGACAGVETAEAHNLRLQIALASLKIKSWPFAGPIGIKEYDIDSNQEEIHVFENWCYLGVARSEQDLAAIMESCSGRMFDLDTYKILHRYLLTKGKKIKILTLEAGSLRPNDNTKSVPEEVA